MIRRIACVVGTRPEVVKMAPIVQALGKQSWAKIVLVATGQHRELLSQTLSVFRLGVDVNLDVMQEDQPLPELTARLIGALDGVLGRESPDMVLAQGDTTSVMVCALACFYRGIPFGHVEAGLRTHDLANPFPEELNRTVTARMASVHFAPTEQARSNLLAEGLRPQTIHLTGNTVIDALQSIVARQGAAAPGPSGEGRLALVTVHRRENFGAPLLRICEAIRRLHQDFPDLTFVFLVHPNPNIADVVHHEFTGLDRVTLAAPLDYEAFLALLNRATLVLTDSGGVQEEAPALGKPVLVARETTERPETVSAGVARLVGTDVEVIVAEAARLLTDPVHYASMARKASLFGDGRAGERIAAILREMLR